MRWIGLGIAAIAPVLAGCSTFPLPDDVTRKSTQAIVEQIRCEARRAVLDYAYHYKDGANRKNTVDYKTATVAYEFTFDITEDNNAMADATWGLPYVLGGNFSLGANGGFNRTRHTTRNFKIVDTFEELRLTKCDGVDPQPENLIYPISGEIGVYEVVKTFINMQQIDNPNSGEVFTFHDTLMFTTFLTAGVQPKLVISPFSDRFRLAAANGNFNATRNDVHTVVITLAGTPIKSPRIALGASFRATAAQLARSTGGGVDLVGLQTNSSLISTTILQSAANPKDRALLELDRERILRLQARSQNLLVGP
jgi:hypothetical protein